MRILTLIASIILISATQLAAQTPSVQTPDLPLPTNPTCFDLARVANKFIALGEEGTVKELERLCKASDQDPFSGWDMDEQVTTLCRIIFKPKEGMKMRGPDSGGLLFGMPLQSMKQEDWPLYPLAESDGVFLMLPRGDIICGLMPESGRQYLDYCRSAGVFRTTPLIIPTEETAQRALNNLVSSPAWKKIIWKDSLSHVLEMKESDVIAYLRTQIKKPKQ